VMVSSSMELSAGGAQQPSRNSLLGNRHATCYPSPAMSFFVSHLAGYVYFAGRNTRLLGFGFVMLFGSGIGQTYFIGVFGPAVRGELGLSHTAWSAIYMAGTLLSALVLPWTGALIDRVALPAYAAAVALALAAAAAFTALVPSAGFLIIAVFLLRKTGQGLMSHTGATAMARYFPADRGKEVALASIDFAAGEALLPVLMVLAIAAIGWRATTDWRRRRPWR